MNSSHEYPIFTPPTPEPPKVEVVSPKKHPYRAALTVAGILLVLFFIFVFVRLGVSGSDMANNWTGAGGVFFTSGRNLTEAQRLSAQEVVKQQSAQTDVGYIPITTANPLADGTSYENDLGALLALLTQSGATSSQQVEVETAGSYSLIPRGLISISESTRAKTPEAQALAVYGNEIGTYIEGFEGMHGNMPQTLKDQAEDRKNPDKIAALKRLGEDLAQLGYDLTVVSSVPIPDQIKAAHKAYATTYRIVGTNLIKVADAKTDEEFLSAINAYNDSVDSLTKRFIALVAIFSANNVIFSSNETGRVFMFNQNTTMQ